MKKYFDVNFLVRFLIEFLLTDGRVKNIINPNLSSIQILLFNFDIPALIEVKRIMLAIKNEDITLKQ